MSNMLKIFPSSLAEDWGRILSEKNVKTILEYLETNNQYIQNATISGFDISNVINNGVLTIGGGKALFEGYQIETTHDSYSIPYPNNLPSQNGDSKTYHICLHLKYTTGNDAISNYVVYEDYKDWDLDNPYTSQSSQSDTIIDYPFVIVEFEDTEGSQIPYENVPDDLGRTTVPPIEEGVVYKYFILYSITINKEASGYTYEIQDRRSREFMPIHESSVGYLDNDINSYYGYLVPGSEIDYNDFKHMDWRKKYSISRGVRNTSLESFLFDYITFIHETVRGYNSREDKDYRLSTLQLTNDGQVVTSVGDDGNNISWDNVWGDSVSANSPTEMGPFLPIQNCNEFRHSIVAHLRYSPDEIVNNDFTTVGNTYINESIVRRSGVKTSAMDTPDSYDYNPYLRYYDVGEYIYESEFSADSDYLVTLNSANLISRKFLPISSGSKTGLVTIDESYYPGEGTSTDLFMYDEYGKVTCYAARYAFASLSADNSGVGLSDIVELTANNVELDLSGSNNRLGDPVIETTVTGTTNSVLTVTFTNPNPVNNAFCIYYDDSILTYNTNEYTINQHLRTFDSPSFRNLILTGYTQESEDNPFVPPYLNMTEYVHITDDDSNSYSPTINVVQSFIDTRTSPEEHEDTSYGTLMINGDLQVSGVVRATKVYSAVYNDYAELFKKADPTQYLEPGDVIAKITTGGYGLAFDGSNKRVVGVYSDSYGQLLGGDDDKTLEENLQEYIPVGLCGRVKVKVKGVVKIGDLLTLSDEAGIACATKDYIPGEIIGKALESKDTAYTELIEMMIMLA